VSYHKNAETDVNIYRVQNKERSAKIMQENKASLE
jgi:hypothetical protein